MNVIYTAIAGNYDRLLPHPHLENCQFVAFVDNPRRQKAEGWELRKITPIHSDPVRNAKQYKVLSHKYFPGTECSLWIDGNISINDGFDLNTLIERYLADSDLALFVHPKRNCTYQEAKTCKGRKYDNPAIIDRQMKKYRSKKFPERYGLTENRILLRRYTPLTVRLNELWWREICEGSRRDQLSLMYSMWRTKTTFTPLPGRASNNPLFFALGHHLHKHRTIP